LIGFGEELMEVYYEKDKHRRFPKINR
jgi:hypothetical protein